MLKLNQIDQHALYQVLANGPADIALSNFRLACEAKDLTVIDIDGLVRVRRGSDYVDVGPAASALLPRRVMDAERASRINAARRGRA